MTPHQPRRPVTIATLALVVAATLSGCSLYGSEGGPGGTGGVGAPGVGAPGGGASGAAGAGSAMDAVAGEDGIQRVDVITSDDLRLTPSLVRAHTGIVEMRFQNTGITPHSVSVWPHGPAQSMLAGTGNFGDGATRTILVDVTTPGRYGFTCVYHASSGMRGTLEVTVAG